MRLSLLAFLLFFGTAVPAYALSPVACTMDVKLCPDGVNYVGRDGNRNCQWQLCPGEMDTCMPYLCQDGTSVDKCSEDGTVINYFAAPCLTHGGEVDPSQFFSDVPVTHPNAAAVAYLKASGIVEGYADGTFKPDSVINRAEFVKILVGTQANESAIRACYEEVEPAHWAFAERMHDEWYAPFVCYAKKFRLVDGYPDGSFRPASNINFVEAAKILVRMFVGDIEADPVWYKPYVEKLSSLNAIPRSIMTFSQPITRGDMAEMIYRLKTGNTYKPSSSYNELETNSGIETHGSLSTFHHNNPAFSFQFPAGWTISDDRGDHDIYINRPNAEVRTIVLTYCDNENCNGPLNECETPYTVETVPILGVKSCRFVYEDGREQWEKIGVPAHESYSFLVEGTKDELKEIWPILAKIRASLQMR